MLRGGCHCGRTRYEVAAAALDDVATCHCTICRRTSGAPITTWATVPETSFRWTAEAPAQYASSGVATRYFCPRCGAQLALVHASWKGSIDFTIATLEAPERFPPTRHIWATTALPWVPLGDLKIEHGET